MAPVSHHVQTRQTCSESVQLEATTQLFQLLIAQFFNSFDDAIQSFCDGIGQTTVNIGKYSLNVLSDR
jgi:hypothetical protein